MQIPGDGLTAQENGIGKNKNVIKNVANVQMKSVGALQEMWGTLIVQQEMQYNITTTLAQLTNLKVEMLDAMKDMLTQQSVK